MPGDLETRFSLGPIDQVAYVVEDVDRAVDSYGALFGPFEVADYSLESCSYRGRSVDCRLRIAVCGAGPVEIELIQVLEGETPHTEHLRRHGEGLHHVRFRVEDLDGKLAELVAAGFVPIFQKRWTSNVAFAYLETPPELGPSVVELLELRSS